MSNFSKIFISNFKQNFCSVFGDPCANIPAAPTNNVAPVLTFTDWDTDITVNTGTWTVSGLTYTYQWQRDGVDIVGETANSYTPDRLLDISHAITCDVTATNAGGSNTATSDTFEAWGIDDVTTDLWLDALDTSTITESGGAVSQWDDKSGFSRHATQGTGSLQPSTGASFNGLNALSFPTGAVHRLDSTLTQLTTASIYYVLDPDDKGIDHNCPLGAVAAGSAGGGCFIVMSAFSSSTPLHNVTYTSFLPSSQLFLNGVAGSDNHGFTPSIFSHQGSGLSTEGRTYTFGVSRNDNLWYYEGKMAEVIICNANHDEATRQKIEGYLAWKWKLQSKLSVGHPYKLTPPTV